METSAKSNETAVKPLPSMMWQRSFSWFSAGSYQRMQGNGHDGIVSFVIGWKFDRGRTFNYTGIATIRTLPNTTGNAMQRQVSGWGDTVSTRCASRGCRSEPAHPNTNPIVRRSASFKSLDLKRPTQRLKSQFSARGRFRYSTKHFWGVSRFHLSG
jgi:hypothetical protein